MEAHGGSGDEDALTPSPERANDYTRVSVAISEREYLGGPVIRVRLLEAALPRAEARAIRDEVERSFLAGGGHINHVIEERSGHHSWGADGGVAHEVILFLAQSTVDGLIAATTVQLFQRLMNRQRKLGLELEAKYEGFTRQQAVEHAKWLISVRYADLNTGSVDDPFDPEAPLDTIGESYETSTDSWTITLQDQHSRYRVKLSALDGIPSSEFIERERLP